LILATTGMKDIDVDLDLTGKAPCLLFLMSKRTGVGLVNNRQCVIGGDTGHFKTRLTNGQLTDGDAIWRETMLTSTSSQCTYHHSLQHDAYLLLVYSTCTP
jgi:hypothetical protein